MRGPALSLPVNISCEFSGQALSLASKGSKGSEGRPTQRQQLSFLDDLRPCRSSTYRFGEELGHGDFGHLSKWA